MHIAAARSLQRAAAFTGRYGLTVVHQKIKQHTMQQNIPVPAIPGSIKKLPAILLILLVSMLPFCQKTMAQEQQQMVRLAKIKVDPLQLNSYTLALKEQMTTALREEAGVLTYYAVADKKDPSSITLLEIYADTAAYKMHIATVHFKKYKDTVKNMVTALELVDVTLLAVAKKPGM